MPKRKSGGDPERIQKRIVEIQGWIYEHHPQILRELKHKMEMSEERAYYLLGYMTALKDVLEILKRLGIKWTLD